MHDTHRDRPRVLVTGGSTAGPALAWALHREGFAPTVLERSPQRREAGQNIDVRGLGREALRRMGIQDAVLADLTGEVGARFVDESGRGPADPCATPPRRPWSPGSGTSPRCSSTRTSAADPALPDAPTTTTHDRSVDP